MLKKIPNILTIGRILIVPFFVLAFYLPGFYGDLTALILFIVASFTDFLDGMLARLLGEESKLGELLDPIADKIIVATALILLVMDGTIRNYEVIAAIIILTREILISGLREFLAKGKIKLPVSNLAKLKTVLQMVSIGLLLSGDTGNRILNFQDYNAQTIGIILFPVSPDNKRAIDTICKTVFNFARFETGSLIFPFAKNSLNPEINISRVKIIIAAITS